MRAPWEPMEPATNHVNVVVHKKMESIFRIWTLNLGGQNGGTKNWDVGPGTPQRELGRMGGGWRRHNPTAGTRWRHNPTARTRSDEGARAEARRHSRRWRRHEFLLFSVGGMVIVDTLRLAVGIFTTA